jgi:hypothetical protein
MKNHPRHHWHGHKA